MVYVLQDLHYVLPTLDANVVYMDQRSAGCFNLAEGYQIQMHFSTERTDSTTQYFVVI